MNDSLYKKSQISSRSELLGKGIQNGGLKGIFEMKMVIFKYLILNNSVGLRWIKFHNSQSSVLAYVVLIAIIQKGKKWITAKMQLRPDW